MFDNIGKKIKTLTKILVWIGIVASIIAGLALLIISGEARDYGQLIGLGLVFLIGGPFLSWVSSFFMYGFGELIDKTCDIQATVCSSNVEKIDFIEQKRREKLDRLLKQGLITQEEYNKAIGNN